MAKRVGTDETVEKIRISPTTGGTTVRVPHSGNIGEPGAMEGYGTKGGNSVRH